MEIGRCSGTPKNKVGVLGVRKIYLSGAGSAVDKEQWE